MYFQRLHLGRARDISGSTSENTGDSNTARARKKVCIIGSGNWGSATAKLVGNNVRALPHLFEEDVQMWVYQETVNGQKLTDIINREHENIKYLPGIKLPPNVRAEEDLLTAAEGGDIFIFVLPHQFVKKVGKQLEGKVKPSAVSVSLIKGFYKRKAGTIHLTSDIIRETMGTQCAVMMGANIASEVAREKFCESTIGCKDKATGALLKNLFQSRYFRIVVVEDEMTVEVCGALKNIVAVGAGFADGLGYGNNTKAAVVRLGLMEMVKFCEVFYPGCKHSTFLESCGMADLIASCYGGRHRLVAEAFVTAGKSIEELEKEMLNGQVLQGPAAADEVNYMLRHLNMDNKFPLFTAIHKICKGELEARELIYCLMTHPKHM